MEKTDLWQKLSGFLQDPLTVYYFPEFCPSSTIIDPNDLVLSSKKITSRLNEERKWKTQKELRRLYFPWNSIIIIIIIVVI